MPDLARPRCIDRLLDDREDLGSSEGARHNNVSHAVHPTPGASA